MLGLFCWCYPPRDLLRAQALVNAAGNAAGFVVTFLLVTAAMSGVGLIIAVLAPNGRIASGVGTALFFVAMLCAGGWTPGAAIPATLRAVADFTPMGAPAVASAVAARLFRWE